MFLAQSGHPDTLNQCPLNEFDLSRTASDFGSAVMKERVQLWHSNTVQAYYGKIQTRAAIDGSIQSFCTFALG